MRRSLFVLAGVLLALGVALGVSLVLDREEPGSPPEPGSAVVVTLDAGKGEPRTATLSCPPGEDSAGCRALAELDDEALAPVPADRVCTQQFGGPEQVRLSGTLRGREVDARFRRTDGCEIARYSRIEPLLTVLELS